MLLTIARYHDFFVKNEQADLTQHHLWSEERRLLESAHRGKPSVQSRDLFDESATSVVVFANITRRLLPEIRYVQFR